MRCLFLAGAASLLVLSCGKTPEKEKPEVKPEITVPSESQAVFSSGLSFEAGPQVQTSKVSFTTTASWSADVTDTKASAWVSVQPASGAAGTVNMTVSAQPNTVEDARRATVTIKCGTVTKAFTVTQAGAPPSDIPVESVSLDKTELSLVEGDSETLTATVKPDNATDKTVTWSSSDGSVATVDANGKVTAVKEGTATITAKAGEKTATCTVTVAKKVIAVESVTLNKESLALVEGDSETLTATVKPDNATDKSVTWSSSDSSVATVDANGKVTAVKEGTATITAKAGEKSATCTVTVKKNVFEISPTRMEMMAGGGSFAVSVRATFGYHVSSKPDWIREKSVSNQIHTFEVGANTSTEKRSGVIVFCDEKGTCLPCNVVQDGAGPFTITPMSVEVESAGGTFEVTVSCSSKYHINSMPEWVKDVTPAGNGKVRVFQVEKQKAEEVRSGVIVFCDEEGTCVPCNVKQKAHVPDTAGGGTEGVTDGDPVKW